ncbi:MAG TPA: peptidoglycan DD-metalloendopeptidase family protein [Candidatus Paceibacterota bacterium]
MPRIWFKLLVWFLVWLAITAHAATLEEIRNQISDRNDEIRKLETQINAYQKELQTIGQTSRSLQSEIARLETTRKKLAADIQVTEQKIIKTNLAIEQLTLEIGNKGQTLERRRAAVEESLRQWRRLQDLSPVEIVLRYNHFSDILTELGALAAFQRQLEQDIFLVSKLKSELETTRLATETERKSLAALKLRLADQRQIAQENQLTKDQLLKQTKNQETNYKKLLAETVTRKEAFEKELTDLESQLRIYIDFNKLPPAGKGILNWPLQNIFVTQEFGKTVAAKRLYVSGTHNGVDFRASIGTPVLAAAPGLVKGTGDTDTACRGASYGKWVLIEHSNGLSTIYGHLSLIKTATGRTVTTGETIGYSGQTGYSTGPHLHLSVVATQGLRLATYNFKSCAGAKITMPLADPSAYLNPLIYL